MQKTMNVAVIGLGWMGRVHLRNYTEMPGVRVAGVMDTNAETLAAMHAQFGVPVFDNLDALLDQPQDAVNICVPTVLHLPVGLAVLARGIPALIEKPLAASAAEGRQLLEAAQKAGVQIMVGHIERFNPAVQRVRELAAEDKVISITIERVGPYPPRIQDVGVVRDLGSHDIDLIRHISGSEYKRVFAVTATTIGKHEDTALITAEMENGVLGQINTNWVTPYKSRSIRVATTSRYIEANLIHQQVKGLTARSGLQRPLPGIKGMAGALPRSPCAAKADGHSGRPARDGTGVPITGPGTG
jgi:predicted dehydrogenase